MVTKSKSKRSDNPIAIDVARLDRKQLRALDRALQDPYEMIEAILAKNGKPGKRTGKETLQQLRARLVAKLCKLSDPLAVLHPKRKRPAKSMSPERRALERQLNALAARLAAEDARIAAQAAAAADKAEQHPTTESEPARSAEAAPDNVVAFPVPAGFQVPATSGTGLGRVWLGGCPHPGSLGAR